jgi:hypothetical protein
MFIDDSVCSSEACLGGRVFNSPAILTNLEKKEWLHIFIEFNIINICQGYLYNPLSIYPVL